MKRKDLQHLKIDSTLFGIQSSSPVTTTIEDIVIQQTDRTEDNLALEDFHYAAGFAPYVRGISPTLYVQQPWQSNQVPQSSSLEKCNQIYRNQIQQGQTEIMLISNPSQEQNAIHSIEEMKVLLNQLPLHEIAVSLYTDESILPLLACYLAAAEELGFEGKSLSGHVQYDLLLTVLTSNGLYTLETAHRIVADLNEYMHQNHPKFNAISLSNKVFQSLNLTADQELAYSLAHGIDQIKAISTPVLSIDYLATHLSFAWSADFHHFTTIAKMRAARGIWAKLLKALNVKNEQALALSIRTQTLPIPLDPNEALEALGPATIEATAAIFGGTQALHLQLPPTPSIGLTAGQMQRFLVEELKSCKTVDPWAGSYYVEKLTLDIANKTWETLQEIERTGGIQPILNQLIQTQIAKQLAEEPKPSPVALAVDPIPSRQTQEVEKALFKLSKGVQTPGENVLALAIEAVKARATLREIHQALLR
ncbi:methylmalonyl-CoA mutase family protein [Myroides odoratus]|uniref:methylmalonyl-CoA mutase family protein n=1 Tax=Myroides odoratus TaxID=256 RepID=UPI000765C151|nr:methylmalonyl-CoA mutase family protein [Myroides odoratus]